MKNQTYIKFAKDFVARLSVSGVVFSIIFGFPSEAAAAFVEADPTALAVVRLPRLIALAGAIFFGAACVWPLLKGTHKLGGEFRLTVGATMQFVFAATIFASVGYEVAVFGVQPPIFYAICLPPAWIVIGIATLLLAGCGGTSERQDDEPDQPVTPPPSQPEGVPGTGYQFAHINISGNLSRHWIDQNALTQNRERLWDNFKAVMSLIMTRLKDKGVLQAIEDQLAADSERLGQDLKIDINFEVQEDNYWRRLANLGAITFCGEPVTIYINVETLTNPQITMEAQVRAVIHELLHAKDCAYRNRGLPSPYPRGHDDPAFKRAEDDLVARAMS